MPRTPALRASALTLLLLVACGGDDPPADETSAGEPTDLVTPAEAAPLPAGPDIWVAELSGDGGAPVLGEARNVTRREGYDNQPQFRADGGLLYTRQEGSATDIWRWDPASDTHAAVTVTDPENEYSPTPLPAGNGFSAVRVEADSAQRLWRFDEDGSDPSVLLEAVDPVGYHAWFDAGTLALFVLGQPATLQLAEVETQAVEVVAENIGRSLQAVPGRRAVSFVQRTEEGTLIRIWDLDTGSAEDFAPGLDGGDDHAWTPEGALLQASGSGLFYWHEPMGHWMPLADFSTEGIVLSRLAVSPDGRWLALVGEPAPAEG